MKGFLTYMRFLLAYDMAGENGEYAYIQACRDLIANDYDIVWC